MSATKRLETRSWLLLLLLLAPASTGSNNSVAFGNVRVSVYAPALLRLEWSAAGAFDDRPTLAFSDRTRSAPFTFAADAARGTLAVNTSRLQLLYSGGGARFDGGNLRVAFEPRPGGAAAQWTPASPNVLRCGTVAGQDRTDCGVPEPDAGSCAAAGCCFDANVNGTNYDQHTSHCYRPVLGGAGNLFGSVSTMDCDLSPLACIQWYKGQLNQGLLSRDGWVVVDDSANPALNSSDFDSPLYFFFHGLRFREALADFSAVSGPMALMDVQSYGVWHSWYHPYSDAEYRATVETYANLSLPLHVAVLDMERGYGGYTWNVALFPDPLGFTQWLKARGLRTIVNTHDVTGVDHCNEVSMYRAMAAAMGVDPSTNATVRCALQDPRYTAALDSIVLSPLLTGGNVSAVDWLWTDWGKDDGVWYRCVDDLGAQPMLWSNYLHAQRSRARGGRGLVLTPYGGLGSHKFPQVGSGDTDVSYDTLAFEVYSTLTAANVLTPWTHDLGGFHQTALLWPTPELWLRWIQFGLFSPSFRTHCTHDGACEPWVSALFLPQSSWVPVFQARAALMPYIYSASWAATTSGVAIVHPLYYDWPELNESYAHVCEYLFGDALLVAPVVQPQLMPRAPIWLPPGCWAPWPLFVNASALGVGTVLTGPLVLANLTFALEDVPVFARCGSVVPMKGLADAAAPPVAPRRLVLVALPGGGAGSATVFEDEGEGLGYARSGAFRLLNATQDDRDAGPLALTITPFAGGAGYPGEPSTRAFSAQFVVAADAPSPSRCTANGAAVPFSSPEAPPPGWWRSLDGRDQHSILVALGEAPSDAAWRIECS